MHRDRKGAYMTQRGRPWLIPYLCDEAPEFTVIKSTQIGFTEMMIADAMSEAKAGYSILYVLPTDNHVTTFVQNRLDPIISRVPYYSVLVEQASNERKGGKRSADSTRLKEIGGNGGVLKIVGSQTESNFAEFPADRLYIDEYDLCDMKNLAQAPQRLGASLDPRQRRISKPTLRDYGIDAEYQRSDQREWWVKCQHCGRYQKLKWWDDGHDPGAPAAFVMRMTDDRLWVAADVTWNPKMEADPGIPCYYCHQDIQRGPAIEDGEWIAAYPSRRNHHGYKVSQMHMTRKPIAPMITDFQEFLGDETKLQEFINSRTAEGYSPPGSRISLEDLKSCERDYTMPDSLTGHDVTMGVDVGARLHVRISENLKGKRRALCVCTVGAFEDLDGLITRYGVGRCCIDAGPELHKAQEFAVKWDGLVTRVRFAHGEFYRSPQIDYVENLLQIDRTTACDAMVASIRRGKMELPRHWRTLDNGVYAAQMQAPARVPKEDNSGNTRFVWDEGTKPDHYFMADVYDNIAAQHLYRSLAGQPVRAS